jgi:hypothetical protein
MLSSRGCTDILIGDHNSLKGLEKAALILTFNSEDQAMALIGNFRGIGTSFNLQENRFYLPTIYPPS